MKYVAIGLLTAVAIALLLHAPTAGASLLPDIAKVELPISSTPLDKLVSPITKQTNKLLPVDITSTPDTLSAEVSLPSSGGQNTTAAPLLDVSVPASVVPNVVNSLTNPSAPPISSSRQNQPVVRSSLLPNVPSLPATSNRSPAAASKATTITPASTKTSSQKSNGLGVLAHANGSSSLPFSPVFTGVASFLGQGIPMNISTPPTNLTSKNTDLTPVLISASVFVLVAAMVMGIVYVMDYTTLIRLGNGRLAHFAQAHDLTQLAAASVVVVGATIVVIFLLVI